MDLPYSPVLADHVRKEWRDGVEQLRVLPRRDLKVVGAAFGLVIAHQLQGISHLFHKHSWFGDAMMAVIALCLFMLLFAFVGEFFGTETWAVTRGELVVSRGIGPLRRTFRYRASDIRELVSGDPKGDDGKAHVHYVFFKPKSGAGRFACRGKSIHFADWVDEAEGEVIVRWLQARLPRTAREMMIGAGYKG